MVQWNLGDICNPEETEKMIDDAKIVVETIKKKKEFLNEEISDEEFLSIIHDMEKLTDVTSKLGGYAEMWLSENTNDSERTAFYAQISQMLTDLGNETLFFNIWFKNVSDETAQRLIDADPQYSYMLRTIRKLRKYTLEEREEQIMNLKDLTGTEALTNLYDIVTNKFTWEFEGKTLTQEEMTQYYRNYDGKKREQVYEMVLSRYAEEEAVLGEIYKNIASDWRNENIKLRGFETPIQVRNIGNDVPDEAVKNLMNVVRKNKYLFNEYMKLKFSLLGIERPKRTDLYAPREKEEDKYTYKEAQDLVLDTYKQFSEEAYNQAKKIFDESHVHSDVYEGKRSGAFCATIQNDVTPYVLTNFTEKQRDVFTLMHEIGHGIHGLLASKQNKFSFHATLPLAETASIFGESLLYRRLIRESDEKKKISLLLDELDGQYASIGRQTFFVLFEEKAHEMIENGATIDELNDAYMVNLKEQFDGVMEVQDYFQHEWKYIPHIYHTPFYCYAYAFGNLLVLSLIKQYEEQGEEFVPKFLKILEYGGSKAPAEVLSEAGFDITNEAFWESGFAIIREEIEELRKLVEKE